MKTVTEGRGRDVNERAEKGRKNKREKAIWNGKIGKKIRRQQLY